MIQQPPAYAASQPQGAVVHQHQMVTVQPGNTAVANANQPPPGNWNAMKITGIIQLVLGSLTIILGIVTMVIRTSFYVIGSPIWCGLLFYVVAGILGVVAGMKRSSSAAVCYMVMSIFACLAACVVIGFSSTSVAVERSCLYSYQSYNNYNDNFNYNYNSYFCTRGHVAVDAMLLILAILEFIMSIIGASMTCGALCYSRPTQTVIHYQAQPQVVIAGQPQGTAYYTAPIPQQQYVYPPQQVVGAPQGQFQPPPQGQFQPPPQAPQAPVEDHQYEPLTK